MKLLIKMFDYTTNVLNANECHTERIRNVNNFDFW